MTSGGDPNKRLLTYVYMALQAGVRLPAGGDIPRLHTLRGLRQTGIVFSAAVRSASIWAQVAGLATAAFHLLAKSVNLIRTRP